MLLILAVGLTFIATAILVGQYFKVNADLKVRRADEAFYKYADDKPFGSAPHVRDFRKYISIDSDTHEFSFDLTGKKASNGADKDSTCVGLRDYGVKRSKCRENVWATVKKSAKTDSNRIVETKDTEPDVEVTNRNMHSIQITDPLLDLETEDIMLPYDT